MNCHDQPTIQQMGSSAKRSSSVENMFRAAKGDIQHIEDKPIGTPTDIPRIIVNGSELLIVDLKNFAETIINELQHSLHHLLHDTDGLIDVDRWSPGPGFGLGELSCLSDAASSSVEQPERLVQWEPCASEKFYVVDQNGNVLWETAPCSSFLTRCEAFEMLIFTGAHVLAEVPLRGKTAAALPILHISEILRLTHPEIEQIWSRYIAHIRPLVVTWQYYLNGYIAGLRAENSLFFGLHRPITVLQLSRALKYHTNRLLGIRIDLSLWRHISVHLNQHAVKLIDCKGMADTAAQVAQMDHSKPAHRFYTK